MPRKPFVIIVISMCFLLSPAVIVLQASIFTLTPVIGPYNVFARLSPHDLFVLALYPLCAVAVFFVRKWGWYVYVFATLYLAAANIVVFALRPQYHVLSLIFYNLTLAVAAGIFFRRAVIAPYFNPTLRWWEQPVRFGLGMYLTIAGRDGGPIQANIIDISESGVFAVCVEPLPEDARLVITLHALGHAILTQAHVRRRVPHNGTTGYGLQFAHPDLAQKTGLRALLRDLRRAGLLNRDRQKRKAPADRRPTAPRFRLNTRVEIDAAGAAAPVTLLNLSRTGCLLGLPPACELNLQTAFRLSLRVFDQSLSVACVPRWTGRWEDRPTCGVAFLYEDARQKRVVRRMLVLSRRAGAANRLKSVRPVSQEKLTEYALRSPYRLVHGIKKRMRLS